MPEELNEYPKSAQLADVLLVSWEKKVLGCGC
jgi:hypothetical protein